MLHRSHAVVLPYTYTSQKLYDVKATDVTQFTALTEKEMGRIKIQKEMIPVGIPKEFLTSV
jgi:hypothetical protein